MAASDIQRDIVEPSLEQNPTKLRHTSNLKTEVSPLLNNDIADNDSASHNDSSATTELEEAATDAAASKLHRKDTAATICLLLIGVFVYWVVSSILSVLLV